jgi:dipeptidyl-peptidase-4
VDYPELAAHTMGFRAGEPHAVTVSTDGSRVFFLRSTGPEDPGRSLWMLDVATGVEVPVSDHAPLDPSAGIGSYAIDPAGRMAAFTFSGALVTAALVQPGSGSGPSAGSVAGPTAGTDAGTVSWRTTATIRPMGGAVDPRPDPTGRRAAYVAAGALRVLHPATGDDVLLAADPDNPDVTWGLPDPAAARHFGRGRGRGYWWSPDGTGVLAERVDRARVERWHVNDPATPECPGASVSYPVAGTPTASVTLHLLDLDGGWVDVHWDRETYPYLVAVSWTDVGGPLVTVLRRLQQHGLVLAVDPRTGETQVHAELADPRWVDPVDGSPCYLADGRVLIGGELAHDGYDARCLFADGGLLTPPPLYVRRVCGRLGSDLLVEASEGEPSEQHLYRVGTRSAAGTEVRRLTATAGWHVGHAGGDTLVVGSASLDHSGTEWTVHTRGAPVARLRSLAVAAPYAPRPLLERVTDRRLPSGVLYPRAHVAGRRLPVLVDVSGEPGRQEVLAIRAHWLERQWWADAGYIVVVVDNRGTAGVAPSFEKAVHRRLADIVLADQVDALEALAAKHADLDLSRIAIRGAGFGGWLAALGVLRRPDIYRCAIAAGPISDWTLYDTVFTERLFGPPGDGQDVYAHNSLLEAAEEPVRTGEARPVLLIQGIADTRVVSAHTMRLSAALVRAERPHSVIPQAGPTRQAPSRLRLELDFLRRNL